MTATFSSQAVPHSRPDEFLRELALNADIVLDGIVRMAIVTDVGYTHQLNPRIGRETPDDEALPVGIEARWLQAGYSARGQMYKLSAFVGLVGDLEKPPRNIRSHIEAWRTKNRETSERELELVRQLEAGIRAHGRLEIRTGGLHGEDPGWRAHEDIAAVAQAQVCITCIAPIHFSNGQWRHDSDSRAEVYDEQLCPKCKGTRAIPSRDYPGEYDKCRDCLLTPGVKSTLNHLADPEQEGRKV